VLAEEERNKKCILYTSLVKKENGNKKAWLNCNKYLVISILQKQSVRVNLLISNLGTNNSHLMLFQFRHAHTLS
jgi:hypothetical protein